MQRRARKSSVQDSLIPRLQSIIKQHRQRGESRLPTIQQLSRTYGVSPVTMWRTIRRLAVAGEVRATPRGGITIAPRESGHAQITLRANTVSANPQSRAEHVADRILGDIATRRYQTDQPFPSYKELKVIYGAGTIVTKKALSSLVESGVLERHLRGYRIGRSAQAITGSTIALLTRSGADSTISATTPRSLELMARIELQCRMQNIHLETVSVTGALGIQPLDSGRKFDMGDLQARREMCGYIVLTTGLLPEELDRICMTLKSSRKPVAIIDDISAIPPDRLSELPKLSPSIALFMFERGYRSGEHLGEYLLARGHTTIACFARETAVAWSQERVAGLLTAYQRVADAGIARVHRISANGRTPDGVPADSSEYTDAEKAFSVVIKKLNPWYREGPLGRQHKAQYRHIVSRFWDYAILRRLMETELTLTPRASAWCFLNDELAQHGLRYLAYAKVDVPRTLSVIGMDNAVESAASGLSSYDFGAEQITGRAIRHILTPVARTHSTHRPVTIAGNVFERRTTRTL